MFEQSLNIPRQDLGFPQNHHDHKSHMGGLWSLRHYCALQGFSSLNCGLVCVTQVLNEVVVDRGPSSYLSNVDLYLDGRLITSVQGDGKDRHTLVPWRQTLQMNQIC